MTGLLIQQHSEHSAEHSSQHSAAFRAFRTPILLAQIPGICNLLETFILAGHLRHLASQLRSQLDHN